MSAPHICLRTPVTVERCPPPAQAGLDRVVGGDKGSWSSFSIEGALDSEQAKRTPARRAGLHPHGTLRTVRVWPRTIRPGVAANMTAGVDQSIVGEVRHDGTAESAPDP